MHLNAADAFFALGAGDVGRCQTLDAVASQLYKVSAAATATNAAMRSLADTAAHADKVARPVSAVDAFGTLMRANRPRMNRSDAEALLPAGTAYIVADTETTGLGGVVLQLAYNIYSRDHDRLHAYNQLLRLPAGEAVSWASYNVHKISKARIDRLGRSALHELQHFVKLATATRVLGGRVVFHNAAFDCAAITRTIARHGGTDVLSAQEAFCTYRKSRQRVGARGGNGTWKGVSNVTLYTHMFKKAPTGNLHDAAVDIAVTAASYREGCKRRWW